MQVSGAIFEATAMCLQSFTDCLAVEALMKDAWAENRLADFNLWVSGIGASARGRASLDSRLALKPEAREVIANQLRLLAGVVDECKKLGQTEPPPPSRQLRIDAWNLAALSETTNLLSESSDHEDLRGRMATLSPEEPPARSFSPWSDDSASDTQSEKEFEPLSSGNPLHENMQNIVMMLNQLARIAVAIRRSGRRSRLQKADQRFEPEEHRDLQKHLITILLAHPEFSKEQIDPSKLSEVQQRLINCNLKRRNRFLYAQHHSKWLYPDAAGRPPQAQDIETIEPRPTTDAESAGENQKSLPLIAKPSSEAADEPMNPTIRTGTSASAISDSLALPQTLIPAPAASTIMSSTVIDLEYPRPPKRKQGALFFTCPCCCQALPVTSSEGNRWKKHVADDLSPYTCILPECVKPEVLFTTKETWRQHLLKEHRSIEYWVCFACGDGTQFHSEDTFVVHTRTEHAQSVPPDQISLLTNVCRRSAPIEIRSCPLCNWPEGEEGEVDKDVLLDHIGRDIHSFSLRALPWADDNGQETDERINHSADKVYDWLIKNKLSKNLDKERPSREKKVYTSEYFQRNAYFAGSSEASSCSELESVASWEEELKKWKQKEGSVAFGSRASDLMSKEEADNESQYRGLEVKENQLGPDHPDTLQTIRNLANAYQNQGRYEEAELLYERALEGNEKLLGPDHPDTLLTIQNLANAYQNQGRYEEAEPLYERALEGNEKLLGPDHPDTLQTIQNLANAYQNQGRYEEAERLYERALEGNEKLLGPDHPYTLQTIQNLANVYQDQGRYEEAERLYERALEGNEKLLGPDHPDTLQTIQNLANAYQNQGRYEEAEPLYERALEGNEKQLGPDHPETLQTIQNLANAYQNQGRYEEAEPLYERALEGNEKQLGPDHPDTLRAIRNLANTYRCRGRYEEAELLYEWALKGIEKQLGPDHPETLQTIQNLAKTYRDQGWYKEAERLYERALKSSEKQLGPDHPDTLRTIQNLANTHRDQGQYEEAERLYERALKGSEKLLGRDHPDTLQTIQNLANVYQDQGRYEEAERLYERVFKGREMMLGKDHPDTLTSASKLGSVWEIPGKYEEVEAIHVQDMAMRKKVLEREHPDTLTRIANLASTYRNQGRSTSANINTVSDDPSPPSRDNFEIAVLCAVGLEGRAVEALFDRVYAGKTIGKDSIDRNAYTVGLIGHHHVVLIWTPNVGGHSAVTMARLSFTKIKRVLVVGICGGVPHTADGEEILLGDVIISTALKNRDGPKHFTNESTRKPDSEMRSLLNKLEASSCRKRLMEISFGYVEELLNMEDFLKARYPGAQEDKLYKPTYLHKHRNLCGVCTRDENADMVCETATNLTCIELECDKSQLVLRHRLEKMGMAAAVEGAKAPNPAVHFGVIASGGTVIKSGQHRDLVAKRDGAIAFEMVGARVLDVIPSVVVIKGVCDYTDGHRDKKWQGYAAVTAAAHMKAFLELKHEILGISVFAGPSDGRTGGGRTDGLTNTPLRMPRRQWAGKYISELFSNKK